MHIYGKEKRPTTPKLIVEKKAYQCQKTDEVTRIARTIIPLFQTDFKKPLAKNLFLEP